ncbi:hypothetical protein PRZ48_002759 [Zasmidium cellare]|uniref:Tachykinin family protein n=1 Tax=Zasmidium cellare TaxID=395010 RepID=A0ABR0ET53_ZASCE|nr:hypothetical protein PRZ48_002759 [Zasmidium cellare]
MPRRPKQPTVTASQTTPSSTVTTGPNTPHSQSSASGASEENDAFAGHHFQQKWDMPLRFVNFDHPSQAKQHRKAVRSHVTSLQHKHKRQKKGLDEGSEASLRSDGGSGAGGGSAKKGRRKRGFVEADDDGPGEASTSDDAERSGFSRTGEVENAEVRTVMSQQVAMGRVDPFAASSADWTINIPSLTDQYLSRARVYMRSQGLAEESQLMHPGLVQPRLYMDGFLFNALITLTTTRVAVTGGGRRCEPLVAWLRNNFLMTIRAAIRRGFDDRKVLAVGMALLIGWELDVGDEGTCEIHLKALPSVINDGIAPEVPKSDFDYGDENKVAAFRGGRRMPPGFDFYGSQNLLPGSLMFHVGSLMYYNPSAPGGSIWMRELWGSIGACAPTQDVALEGALEKTLSSRIAQLVRQAGIMLGSFMRMSAGERAVAQPLITGIRALWHATLSNEWHSMIGTIYDEILLWCLCVFCTTSGYRDCNHMEAIGQLLVNSDIRNLERLLALLGAYLCPSCLHAPVAELWAHIFGAHTQDAFGQV